MFTHPSNWFDQRLAHFEGRAADAGLVIGHGHALQLTAGAAGAKSYESLTMSGRLEKDESPYFDVDLAGERALALRGEKAKRVLTELEVQQALRIAEQVFEEASDPKTKLAWHIAEAVACGCEFYPEAGYTGAAILMPDDWQAAGEVASADNFVDFQYESLPWPSIAPFAHAKPDRSLDGRYSVEPGATLNVLASLKPETVDDLLRHAERLVAGSNR